MEIQELLNSKIYVKENSSINFNSPKTYIEPFIEEVTKLTSNFRIEVSNKVTNLNEEDSLENTAYGRYKIEAIMPSEYDVQDSESTVGLIVALDNAKPVMKVFSGKNVKACINLTIFNPDYVYTQELMGNAKSVYTKTKEYVQEMVQSIEEYNKRVIQLKETIYTGNQLRELHGRLIEGGLKNSKLGHTVVVQAMRELMDSKSKYYAKNDSTTAWNYYNAITEYVKNADILDRPTKTLLLSDLFLRQN